MMAVITVAVGKKKVKTVDFWPDGTEISARSLRDGAIAKLEAERLLKAERRKALEEIKARAAELLRKDRKDEH